MNEAERGSLPFLFFERDSRVWYNEKTTFIGVWRSERL
jgi:hypothetical protein